LIWKKFFHNKQATTEPSRLITCQDCWHQISKKAATCPKCGAPTNWGKKQARKIKITKRGNAQGCGCLLILLSIILGLTIVGLPFALVIGFIGLVILIVGFLPVF